MIEYDRIDLDEGIDVNKTSSSRECWLCHFLVFLDKNFSYQKYYCDGCHNMSMKTVSIKNLAIVYSKGNAYRINFWNMSKDDATKVVIYGVFWRNLVRAKLNFSNQIKKIIP